MLPSQALFSERYKRAKEAQSFSPPPRLQRTHTVITFLPKPLNSMPAEHQQLRINAWPNRSSGNINIRISSKVYEPVCVKAVGAFDRILFTAVSYPGTVLRLGSSRKAGLYWIEGIQGKLRTAIGVYQI